MKAVKLDINYTEYSSAEEMNPQDRQLVEAAIEAQKGSYAPYSRFNVGAALRLEDGTIVKGANQENAAFPSGLCAERSAIFAAQSMQPHLSITTLAIAARNDSGFILTPITPCGACRQVILEMEDRYNRPIRILLYGENGVYELSSVKDLLPLSFVDANMKF